MAALAIPSDSMQDIVSDPTETLTIDSSSDLLHRSLAHTPQTVVSGSGIYLTLSSGQKILDGCGGAAVVVIGHGEKAVQDAVVKQMSEVSYVHTMGYTTSSAERLATNLLQNNNLRRNANQPGKQAKLEFSKVYLVGSGSEAMDAALKLARQYFVEKGESQRTHFIARRQAYHGNTVGAMSVSSNLPRRAPYQGSLLLPNVSFVSPAYTYRDQRPGENETDYASRLVTELEEEIQRVGPETVVAFIAETQCGATLACATAPATYFQKVRQVCDRYGILLILDEVMCGSGRTGTFFAFEQEGEHIDPDILTLGKGLGGGYAPIAGVLIREKVVDVLRKGTGSFAHGHTYQAHPVSCAAALAVQEVLQRRELIPRCAELGVLLRRLLEEKLGKAKYVGDIRGRGLFWALEFVKDRETKETFDEKIGFGMRVQEEAFEMGLAVYPGRGTVDGTRGDHVILAPPYTITDEEMRLLVDRLADAYNVVETEVEAMIEVERLSDQGVLY